MNKIYFIEVTNPKGETGFVRESKTGLQIIIGAIDARITQYKSWDVTNRRIRQLELNKNGSTAKVVSNQDVIDRKENGLSLASDNKIIYWLENNKGEKLFYDTKNEGYLFQQGDVGYCIWWDELLQELKDFIVMMKFDESEGIEIKEKKQFNPMYQYIRLSDRLIILKNGKKLFGFKIKDEIKELIRSECSRFGKPSDYFLMTQIQYQGSPKQY